LNGSSFSAYTPLWFAVSNGYNDLVKLILNYNTSPSIVDKTSKKANFTLNQNDLDLLIQDDDHIGIARGPISVTTGQQLQQQQQTSYLFSPLRASIVYSRFQIMVYLMEYGANVYELFGSNLNEINKTTTSDDFVNALKLLHRQFAPFIAQTPANSKQTLNEYDICLNKLNEFILCTNVYRRMLLEFVKSVYTKIETNAILTSQLSLNLNTTNSRNTLSNISILTGYYEKSLDASREDWNDYLTLVNDFFVSIDLLLSQQEQNPILNSVLNQLSRKPKFYQNLFEFSKFLMDKYFAPKTLKELCRFRLRAILLDKITYDKEAKYSRTFTKRDHLVKILETFKLPNYLLKYLLHSS
jgi:hypothetical protein